MRYVLTLCLILVAAPAIAHEPEEPSAFGYATAAATDWVKSGSLTYALGLGARQDHTREPGRTQAFGIGVVEYTLGGVGLRLEAEQFIREKWEQTWDRPTVFKGAVFYKWGGNQPWSN